MSELAKQPRHLDLEAQGEQPIVPTQFVDMIHDSTHEQYSATLARLAHTDSGLESIHNTLAILEAKESHEDEEGRQTAQSQFEQDEQSARAEYEETIALAARKLQETQQRNTQRLEQDLARLEELRRLALGFTAEVREGARQIFRDKLLLEISNRNKLAEFNENEERLRDVIEYRQQLQAAFDERISMLGLVVSDVQVVEHAINKNMERRFELMEAIDALSSAHLTQPTDTMSDEEKVAYMTQLRDFGYGLPACQQEVAERDWLITKNDELQTKLLSLKANKRGLEQEIADLRDQIVLADNILKKVTQDCVDAAMHVEALAQKSDVLVGAVDSIEQLSHLDDQVPPSALTVRALNALRTHIQARSHRSGDPIEPIMLYPVEDTSTDLAAAFDEYDTGISVQLELGQPAVVDTVEDVFNAGELSTDTIFGLHAIGEQLIEQTDAPSGGSSKLFEQIRNVTITKN